METWEADKPIKENVIQRAENVEKHRYSHVITCCKTWGRAQNTDFCLKITASVSWLYIENYFFLKNGSINY